MERLDKLICSQGMRSRREIGGVIRRGGVTVNGAVCRDPARKVDPAADTVSVEGEVLRVSAFVYYMLNKPQGVVSATEDKKYPTVLDLIAFTTRSSIRSGSTRTPSAHAACCSPTTATWRTASFRRRST